MDNKFKEEDKKAVIDFLNHMAKHATWKHTTEEAIQFFKLLNKMQSVIVPKINDNILEIIKVTEAPQKGKKGKK